MTDVRVISGRTRLLGTPLRTTGRTTTLVLADGSDLETPVTSGSPDFLGRPEAFVMASEAVEGWFEQSRRATR